jgi:hypothetical protein
MELVLIRVSMALNSRTTVMMKGGAKTLAGLRKSKKSRKTVCVPVDA